MNENPSVSVIIPVYNTAKYLRKCLDSVKNQTLKNIEIICVDDGSTDNSLNILYEYANRDSCFRIFKQNNLGSGPARNKGIANAKGLFIAFIDPDDWYPNNETLTLLFNTAVNNHVSICGGTAEFWSNDTRIELPESAKDMKLVKEGLMTFREYQYPVGFWRFIFEREMLLRYKITFPAYMRGQDAVFFINAMAIADTFYALKTVTYCYRVSHKIVQWDYEKANDYLRTIRDMAVLSNKKNLSKLHTFTIKTYIGFYPSIIKRGIHKNNKDFSQLIREINDNINETLFYEKYPSLVDKYIIYPFSKLWFRNAPFSEFCIYASSTKCMLLNIYWYVQYKGLKKLVTHIIEKCLKLKYK